MGLVALAVSRAALSFSSSAMTSAMLVLPLVSPRKLCGKSDGGNKKLRWRKLRYYNLFSIAEAAMKNDRSVEKMIWMLTTIIVVMLVLTIVGLVFRLW